VKSFFSKLSDKPANQPQGHQRSRQLLKKPPNPVKQLFRKEIEAFPDRNTWKLLRTSSYFWEGGF
ncbi:hypothetical protein, partial [Caulobacter sp. 602-1]|uniref:hypothetical protein n=1 Tax=Caulobacter sp. 602-1 TaxID=2492472 RepID=UPI001F32B771